MKAQLQDMLRYNEEANSIYIAFLEKLKEKNEQAVKLMSHVLNAHTAWNARITGETAGVAPWDVHPLDQLQSIQQKNQQDTNRIIDIFDLESIVDYGNTKGQSYQSSVRQILTQVINHGTYHRGQIAMVLKAAGHQPPATDYIFLRR